jgi:hypothetical protein
MQANALSFNAEVFAPDGLSWSGTLIGSDEFVVAVIGSQGNALADRVTVNADGGMSDRYPSLEPLSSGTARIMFLTYGTNGVFGDGEFEIGEDLAVAAFGDGNRTEVESTPQNLVSIIEGAGSLNLDQREVQNLIRTTVEQSVTEAGSQDLIVAASVEIVDESETRIADIVPSSVAENAEGIVPIEVGETIVIRGTTNRNPAVTDISVAVTGGQSADGLTKSVNEWDEDGVWSAEISTEELSPGEYTVLADDGEFVYEQTVNIVAEGTFAPGERFEASTGELQSRMRELEQQLNNLQSERDSLEEAGEQERVEELENEIQEIEGQIQEIQTRLERKSGGAGTLEVSIDRANSARVGEALEIITTVTNPTSDSPAEGQVEAEVPNVGVQAKQVEVEGGSSRTVEFAIPTERGQQGTYTATVATEGDSDSTDVNINRASGGQDTDVVEGNGDGNNETNENLLEQLNDRADSPLLFGGVAGLIGGGILGGSYLVYRGRGSGDKHRTVAKECPECGIRMDTSKAFCGSCGTQINEDSSEDTASESLSVSSYDKVTANELIESNSKYQVHNASVEGSNKSAWMVTLSTEGNRTLESSRTQDFLEDIRPWDKMDDHPNLLSVYGHGTDPLPWLVMESGNHTTVLDMVDKLSNDQKIDILTEVCEGVHHVHRYGITYQNLSIDSVTVTDGTNVKLRGVLDYLNKMSDSKVTDQTVIYNIGNIAKELLTGPSANSVPDEVWREIDRALSEEPAERHDTVLHFRDSLRQAYE